MPDGIPFTEIGIVIATHLNIIWFWTIVNVDLSVLFYKLFNTSTRV